MGVSIEQLRCAVAVATSESFSEASRLMNLTQPAVSRSVRALEGMVGVTLFTRSTRRVELTADGAEFLAVAREIVDAYDTGLQRFAAYQRAEAGSLTVAALPMIAGGALTRVVAEFLVTHPHIRLQVVTGSAAHLLEQLRQGEAHLAITEEPDDTSGLSILPLGRDPMLAVLRADHPLATAENITWAQLADYPFVTMAEGTSVRRLSDEAFARAGRHPRTTLVTDATVTAAAMVSAGVGVTAFPQTSLPFSIGTDLRFVPIESPVVTRSLAVVMPLTPSPSVLTRRFVDALLSTRKE